MPIEIIGLIVSLVLIMSGLITLRDPAWMYRGMYRLTRAIGRVPLSPWQRRDMDLLFNQPDQWREEHHDTLNWLRLANGCGPLLVGLLGLSVAIASLVATTR